MSTEFITKNIAKDLGLKDTAVNSTVSLFLDGATTPFIARYRKERTGGLDETEIRSIHEKLEYYKELEKRKETILKSIKSQNKLIPELKEKIERCTDKTRLEDIYLPYKPKKKTRASVAKEKGLEPLAHIIYNQKYTNGSKKEIVQKFINPGKGIKTYDDAITGAQDIIAETIADKEFIRTWIRNNVQRGGLIVSKAKKEWAGKKSKYNNYYSHKELVRKSPSHRMLAIRRGTKENILSWKIEIDEDYMISFIESRVIKNKNSIFTPELKTAIKDSYKRLIFPSIEKEVFNLKIKEAEREAISVFSKNIKNLLLAPPADSKTVMGLDPGYRTGCKIAIVDSKGDFKKSETIYPHAPENRAEESQKTLLRLIKEYNVELIAIGSGTASRETDTLVRDLIKKHNLKSKSIVVSEAGASVYSASKTAIKEFPHLDVTIRGAISIARRLQDPLAELVKIEPGSIGVGQYQHDVDKHDLKGSLDETIESCVNHVGVELNTASSELLLHVSGIGPSLAENIVKYRSKNSPFKSREQLKKVPTLGPKVFEQCAGFLKIRNSKNPLDNSAIHPETYHITEKIAKDHNLSISEIIGNEKLISTIRIENYVTEEYGILTLQDILNELKKPGLDPRKTFTSIEFHAGINEISDLKEDMILDGTVTNVVNFGAFVDIGVHQDGLIHISKLSKKFVKNPADLISVGDTVKVKVASIDTGLKRISLEKIG